MLFFKKGLDKAVRYIQKEKYEKADKVIQTHISHAAESLSIILRLQKNVEEYRTLLKGTDSFSKKQGKKNKKKKGKKKQKRTMMKKVHMGSHLQEAQATLNLIKSDLKLLHKKGKKLLKD